MWMIVKSEQLDDKKWGLPEKNIIARAYFGKMSLTTAFRSKCVYYDASGMVFCKKR